MSGSAKKLLHAAAGTAASGDKVYVEDVFATHLYNGNSGSQSINNSIDLDGEGGLVWIKSREDAADHALYDTERNSNNVIHANDSAGEDSNTPLKNDTSNAFTSTGFDLNTATGITNNDNYIYTSWTFRKQTGFFDIVKWTGTGGNLTVNHNLGCVPGMILIKNLGGAHQWKVYHVGTDSSNPQNKYLALDGYNAAATAGNAYFQQTAPTSTSFYVGSNADCNENGQSMVAYLFAAGTDSDSQIFGDDGDEAIIKCGSYQSTGNGDEVFVNLGFEPQWVMIKSTTDTNSGYDPYGQPWLMQDIMRGMAHHPDPPSTMINPSLFANLNGAENSTGTGGWARAEATGMTIGVAGAINMFNSVQTYAYVAIRRGPMKEPDAGTDVYIADESHASSYEDPMFQGTFPVDMSYFFDSVGGSAVYLGTRLTGKGNGQIDTADAFVSETNHMFDYMNGWYDRGSGSDDNNIAHMFRRYPKVFDVVYYTGTGSSLNVTHNLKATPELIIIKKTSEASYAGWTVYYGTGSNVILNKNHATGHWFSNAVTAASATTFTAAANTDVNDSGESHIAFLFASLSGISKVGTYTGTGSNFNVTDLGAPVRYLLVKRIDSTGGATAGHWGVFDSTVQGINSGHDPFPYLSSTDQSLTTNQDVIDQHSSGFTVKDDVNSGFNINGGTYLYLAIA